MEQILEILGKFSNGDTIKNYELLRKDMFDCLCWPAYAVSINQLRSAKYRDRLDLLFMDLYRFYEIVSENTEISEKTMAEIWGKCKLARAYIYPNTFYWLRSFGDFKSFIYNRKLSPFLEEKNGRPDVWAKAEEGSDPEYFLETERLILRKFTENDLKAVYEIYSDQETNTFLPWFPLKTMEEAKEFFETNFPIGYINVGIDDSFDFGYGLREVFWHKGITTEACKAVLSN